MTAQTVSRVSSRPSLALSLFAALITPVLYVAFVAHYGVNTLFADDWTILPAVESAIHHNLSWQLLWGQHNESRLLLPNLLFILFGLFDHLNLKTIMYFSALIFVAGYFLLLASYRRYAGRQLGILPTLLIGLVWFSLSEVENSLWAFQLPWFIVDFCLVLLLFIFSCNLRRYITVPTAILVAVAASVSLLQGLLLWPVGLLCLLWQRRNRRQTYRESSIWVVSAVVTAVLYFRGYNFSTAATGGGSVRFAFTHPLASIEYILAATGNVFPVNGPASHASLILRESVGLVLVVVGVLVSILALRDRREGRLVPLPAALILFAILFDVSIALGRSSVGTAQALSSRYTMANLLLLIGIALYGFSRKADPLRVRRSRTRSLTSPIAIGAVNGALVILLAAQAYQSMNVGIPAARSVKSTREAGARIILALKRLPPSQANALVTEYVYPPGLAPIAPLVTGARRDKLSIFASEAQRPYTGQAPPR